MKADLGPYWSPEVRMQSVRSLAERAQAEVVEYGHSRDGEPLLAVRLPGGSSKSRLRVMCSANLHGPEFVGGRVAVAVLEAAAASDLRVQALRERAELWVFPCLNPDGYRRTWEARGVGPLAQLRTNAAGVDLNRNFPRPLGAPVPWIPGAGSSRTGDATYRGPSPLSEPETAALDRVLAAHPMHASANLHSFMGTLIPAHVRDAPSFATYRRLCRAFCRNQRDSRYRRLSSRWLDVFTGELEDHQHHTHRTWAMCIEVFPVVASLRQHLRAPSVFWRFNPRDCDRWIQNDLPAVLAFLQTSLDEPPPTVGRLPAGLNRTDS